MSSEHVDEQAHQDFHSATVGIYRQKVRQSIAGTVQTLNQLPVQNLLRSYWDVLGVDGGERPRLTQWVPSSPEIDRMDEVLGWLCWIEDIRMRRAVLLRAAALGWRRIGLVIGCSHETARRLERQGIDTILARLLVERAAE